MPDCDTITPTQETDRKEVFLMTAERKNDRSTIRIALIGMMAAIVFVGNYLRIPFMETKLTVVNALCVLSGLFLGPAGGFLASGIGSLFYDILTGYGLESLITFVSKGAIGLIAGLVASRALLSPSFGKKEMALVVLGAVLGAFAYVALYMLKTYYFSIFVNGMTGSAALLRMAGKFPGSAMNALFASIAAPLLSSVLRPALQHAGLLDRL
ncbi:MAG: ECF transporter S component [Clostridia bacterium]|nr:ECF transporter S component [Clostridia bacterium]